MENLDERDLTAARYLRTIHSIAQGQLGHADAIRIAIFVLYLDISGQRQSILLADPHSPSEQAKVLARAYDEVRVAHGQRPGGAPDFQLLGDFGLAVLLRQTADEEDPEDKIHQFDYLVDALLSLTIQDPTALPVEKFSACFAKHIVGKGSALVDLGRNSTGELGTQVQQASDLWLSELTHGAEFEVLLKLEVHGRHVNRYAIKAVERLPASSFLFFLPPRKDALIDDFQRAKHEDLPGISGLTMGTWFGRRAKRGWTALTLLTLRECREGGARRELRREIVLAGNVRAVIELPKRVAKSNRRFMLALGAPSSAYEDDEIYFIDGRYCDVLRDEPLERIAAFVSVPMLARSLTDLERAWPDWRSALGSELALRASKMFFGEQREARGLYRTVSRQQVLASTQLLLEPARWIEPMDSASAFAMLDPTPLHELLDSQQPRCAYVIGNNGVGKSFLLRGLVDHYVKRGRRVRALSSTSSDRFPPSSVEIQNYLYMGARTTPTGTSNKKLARQMLDLLRTIHKDHDRAEVLDKASELVGFKGKYFVLPPDMKATPNALADLKTIDEVAFTELHDSNMPGFQRSDSTVIVPFDHLSSGEQQMLLLLTRLVAEAEEGTLFIIDEPEASLHVAWQRALPGVLNVVRDEFKVHFAVATHSPVLLSAAVGPCNYRFAARGGLVEPLSERVRSVERILFDGFDTYTEGNREVHERCAEIVSSTIEQVNLGETNAMTRALIELDDMRHIVELSIAPLGEDRAAAHLRLIDRAKLVLTGLDEERVSAGVIG